jgi:hypothetical protein
MTSKIANNYLPRIVCAVFVSQKKRIVCAEPQSQMVLAIVSDSRPHHSFVITCAVTVRKMVCDM